MLHLSDVREGDPRLAKRLRSFLGLATVPGGDNGLVDGPAKDVAPAGDGAEVAGVGGVILELAAEPADADPEVLPIVAILWPPRAAQQVLVRDQPSVVCRQLGQKLPLGRAKGNLAALQEQPPLVEV